MKKAMTCHHKPWYKNLFVISILLTTTLLVGSFFIPLLNPVYNAFMDYMSLIWWAILLGFAIGGIIDYLVPKEYISVTLGQKKKSTILYATGLGFVMSVCSHGILAISIELYKKGASIPSVIAFLLAAPWANLTVTLMLFAFFGFKAVFFVVSAIIIAIITGLIYQVLEKKNLIEKSKTVRISKGFSIKKDIKKRWKKWSCTAKSVKTIIKGTALGSWALTKMVLGWVLIGMLMASVARAFVPIQIFQQYFGPSMLGLAITLIAATIIEVCSEGTSPLAFEIYRQTGAFGNSFVFLMAGVATDYTEIGLLWSNIGKKTAMWLPIITVPQIIIVAILFNMFL